MPYRTSGPPCRVHLVALRDLPAATLTQCHTLRQEAGRLWMELVGMHAPARLQGQWLSAGDREQAPKGGKSALGRQTVQTLCQRLAAPVATATERRQQASAETGPLQTAYPQHPQPYQTVIGKDQGVTWDRPRCIGLKNGRGRP